MNGSDGNDAGSRQNALTKTAGPGELISAINTTTTTTTTAATTIKQPIAIPTANNTTTTQPNSRTNKSLTTFKGSDSNNNNTNNKKRPLTSGATSKLAKLDRNSLESINSKFSNSSANDDSLSPQQHQHHHHHHEQAKNSSSQMPTAAATATTDNINAITTRPSLQTVEVRYVSPPVISGNGSSNWRQLDSDDLFKNNNKEPNNNNNSQSDNQHGLVAMRNLNDYYAKQGAPLATTADSKGSMGTMTQSEKSPKGRQRRRKLSGSSSPDGGGGGGGSVATVKTMATNGRNLKPPFMFAGIVASFIGSIFFSISILCIKLLPETEGFQQKAKALFFRGLFVGMFCMIAIICQKSTFRVRRDELWVNILRSVFGTMAVFGSYCSLKYISMGDATALVFSSPVWTSILGHIILKEPLQWLQLLALPASMFGIVLIAHPALVISGEYLYPVAPVASLNGSTAAGTTTAIATFNLTATTIVAEPELGVAATSEAFDFDHRWPGIVISLFTSLLVSANYIVLKFRKNTPIQTTTFWFAMTMLAASIAIMSAIGFGDPIVPDTLLEWSLYLGNGVTSWLGQSFLQWAFLHEDAGILSIVRTLDVAMTFVLSALFLHEEILWTSLVGAMIIGLVVASIMLNSWISSLNCMSKGVAAADATAAPSGEEEGDEEEPVDNGCEKKSAPLKVAVSRTGGSMSKGRSSSHHYTVAKVS